MNDSTRNAAADLLFSRESTCEGSAKGIGLSIWRFNTGAGSSEQGTGSGIAAEDRRTGSLVDEKGAIVPGGQSGTRWMLKAAKQRGLETVVMFSNSPPVWLTQNGKAFAGKPGISNLPWHNNKAYAAYLVNIALQLERDSIRIDFISPVNEPEWGWSSADGQEGCPYPNHQIAAVARELNSALDSAHLKASVQIPESGLLLFANSSMRFKPGRQNQVRSFFNPRSTDYTGNLGHMARQVCAHSYFTEWPLWANRQVRKKTSRITGKYGIEYWMSEYCILRKTRDISGSGRDTGMKTALYVARVVHHDLVYGSASAWCWWLGISSADFKDGLLYVDPDGTRLTESKTLWGLGNFSRFIHPGASRIVVEGKKDPGFMVSAYRNPGTNELVIVVINMKDSEQELDLENLPEGRLEAWETSSTHDLQSRPVNRKGRCLVIPPESITTFLLNTPGSTDSL